ncbi:hypothetical protein ACLOJK_013850 [Asimina triloba]
MEEDRSVVLRGCSSESETEPETDPIEISAAARAPIVLPAAARSRRLLSAGAKFQRLRSSPLVHSAIARSQKLPASGTPPSSPLVFRFYMLAPAMVCFSFRRRSSPSLSHFACIRAFPLYNGSDVKLDVDAVGALDVFDGMPERNLASVNVCFN